MGLDRIELLIRFEDGFGIAIPDEVAPELTTPRRVTEYLLSRLHLGHQTSCIPQQAFYRLRKEFLSLTKTQRTEFRPTVELSQLFPDDRRKQVWTEASSQLGVSVLPELVRPRWLVSVLALLILATAIVMFLQFRSISGRNDLAFFLSALIAGALAHGSELVTRSLRSEFSREYTTVGDLAEYLALHSPHTFKKHWTHYEIAKTVRQIIIDQTGLHDFHEDSRFLEDMHLD